VTFQLPKHGIQRKANDRKSPKWERLPRCIIHGRSLILQQLSNVAISKHCRCRRFRTRICSCKFSGGIPEKSSICL